MDGNKMIYILGCGAIGFPLAVFLANAGKTVIGVRTSRSDEAFHPVEITVQNGSNQARAPIQTVSLSRLDQLDGLMVVTAKSYANREIALALKRKTVSGPIVVMQNGIGVEQPFLEEGNSPVYRCVLYITSQAISEHAFNTRPIKPSAIGVIRGDDQEAKNIVEALNTEGFPFRTEANIQKEIWKKAIVNSVFNSICPLLDIDNGVFHRDPEVTRLATELVRECLALTQRLNIDLSEREIMDQIGQISQGSDGQLISTLQDIKNGRRTEIESLNLEIARIGAGMEPKIELPKVEILGKMILIKSLEPKR